MQTSQIRPKLPRLTVHTITQQYIEGGTTLIARCPLFTSSKSYVRRSGLQDMHRYRRPYEGSSKNMFEKGYIEDPKYQSRYCSEHSNTVKLRSFIEEEQVLSSADEFHISKVLRRLTRKNNSVYDIGWKG